MATNRFPPIRSTSAPSSDANTPLSNPSPPNRGSSANPASAVSEFPIDPETVADLFYDGKTDLFDEINKLQTLLNLSSSRTVLKKFYQSKNPMNRSKFRLFVTSKFDLIDGNVADEIFSCSINQFSNYEDGDADGDDEELPDVDMTKGQFTTAVVRLANLWALMNEGMADSSQLTRQTTQFLKYIS